jgi:hypothetical protein
MTARHATELLYDSEAALRLVDSAIEDLRDADTRDVASGADPKVSPEMQELLAVTGSLGLAGLTQILARGYVAIVGALGRLRESRDVLEKTRADKLQHMHDKLREVTSATETAATDILNGLDRAVALVDAMDRKASEGDAAAGAELRNTLRDELFSLMGCMQFQDITTQQLSYASSVLIDTETRLADLARLLDPAALGAVAGMDAHAAPALRPREPAAFDPTASTGSAEARQAVADEIFGESGGRSA